MPFMIGLTSVATMRDSVEYKSIAYAAHIDFGRFYVYESGLAHRNSGRKKAHKHKLFALVNVQMALGQTAGCPGVNRAKKFMCSPRNTGNINFSLWLTGGLSQGCPGFQKVYVFKVYVPFSCPRNRSDFCDFCDCDAHRGTQN